MALAHERAIGHSIDVRFFDAHNAVIRTGQRAEQPAESHRARSRHHAGFIAVIAGLVLVFDLLYYFPNLNPAHAP